MKNAIAVSTNPSEITLSIPPKDIKRLEDPFDRRRYVYEVQAPISEVAKLPIGNANPRQQNLNSRISRDIRDTLNSTPDLFHLKNRGIWVAVESADYDNQTGKLILNCPQNSSKAYGTIDGGHTLANIRQFLNDRKEDGEARGKMPYVMLHIRVGIEDELPDLVETLNRSAQLKEYTLLNYKGEFDELEKLLRKESFGQEIDYKENGEGEYDIVDVLQRLALFSNEIFPGKYGRHPIEAYRSKAKCLDYYLANKKGFLSLAPVIGDCFRLPDQIERMLPEISGSGRFGGFQFAQRLRKPEMRISIRNISPGGGIRSWDRSYNVSTGVTFPLTASLRVLISRRKDGSIVGWKQDPVDFFMKHGRDLFQPINDSPDKSPSVLGKDPHFWERLYHLTYECLHPEE
ncbi:MAG: AIPR family protein [Nitrospirae bacterium]|nr:AIPR family protein [Nitrospirota bacterium]